VTAHEVRVRVGIAGTYPREDLCIVACAQGRSS
jgi:hypothetical protein